MWSRGNVRTARDLHERSLGPDLVLQPESLQVHDCRIVVRPCDMALEIRGKVLNARIGSRFLAHVHARERLVEVRLQLIAQLGVEQQLLDFFRSTAGEG